MYPKQELTNDRITYLIYNAISGKLTSEQQLELQAWRENASINEDLFNEISSGSLSIPGEWKKRDSQEAFAKLQGRLKFARKRRLFILWGSAAASIVIALTTWLLYPKLTLNTSNDQLLTAKNIPSGKYGALLSVNGKHIDLSGNLSGLVVNDQKLAFGDGTELKQEDGSKVSATELTAITAKGFTYHLVLSDGTAVWLNANSRLQFPSSFKNLKRREVSLEGEGYFEVKHNATQPFIVHSPRSITKDIGTAFNIKDYQDDAAAKSTLIEGSTMVFATKTDHIAPHSSAGTLLVPGQQAIIAGETLKVNTVDLEENIAWKTGYFRFNNAKLPEIMKNLSRWYNIEVVFDGEESEEGFYGTISRNKTLYEVLRMLEDTKDVEFSVKGRRVTVKAKK